MAPPILDGVRSCDLTYACYVKQVVQLTGPLSYVSIRLDTEHAVHLRFIMLDVKNEKSETAHVHFTRKMRYFFTAFVEQTKRNRIALVST